MSDIGGGKFQHVVTYHHISASEPELHQFERGSGQEKGWRYLELSCVNLLLIDTGE
jgi:hypothetical protein